ncbi:hypothetical protein [Microseira wollei]|uniref:Uncharacterized protein n=1 Tax=Microseira wollei NIES-4236 TaxID=2530354 RepID=A0AAV3XAB3_9CYAN|nr:hypothetical protein [Microseira wollei]GET39108.1 hypothetical protein MiSe_38720 [Microseira wollei NIES-4236]
MPSCSTVKAAPQSNPCGEDSFEQLTQYPGHNYFLLVFPPGHWVNDSESTMAKMILIGSQIKTPILINSDSFIPNSAGAGK